MNITGLVVIGALIVLLVSAAYRWLPRQHEHGVASRRDGADRHPDPTIGFRDPYR